MLIHNQGKDTEEQLDLHRSYVKIIFHKPEIHFVLFGTNILLKLFFLIPLVSHQI